MPLNPLTRLGTPNVGRKPPERAHSYENAAPDEPGLVQPVTESYAGANNAYRGIVDHGGPVTNAEAQAEPVVDEWDATRDAYFTPRTPEPDPVPVRIVTREGEHGRKITIYRNVKGDPASTGVQTFQLLSTAGEVQLTVIGQAGDIVWIGNSQGDAQSLNAGACVPLQGGVTVQRFRANGPLWVGMAAGVSVYVGVIAEMVNP